MNKFIIFVGENHGESESTGKPYHIYKFFEVFSDDNNVVRYKVVDLFAKRPIAGTKSIDFGSRVELTFVESDDIGGRPVLVGIDVIEACPFIVGA